MKNKENLLFKSAPAFAANWKNVLRFMLQNNSPAIDAGIEIEGHAGKDCKYST